MNDVKRSRDKPKPIPRSLLENVASGAVVIAAFGAIYFGVLQYGINSALVGMNSELVGMSKQQVEMSKVQLAMSKVVAVTALVPSSLSPHNFFLAGRRAAYLRK